MTKGVSCLHECFTIHPKARLFCKSTSIDLFSNTTKHFSLRIRYVIRHWRFLPGTSVIMFSVKCIVSSTAVSKPSICGLSPPTHTFTIYLAFLYQSCHFRNMSVHVEERSGMVHLIAWRPKAKELSVKCFKDIIRWGNLLKCNILNSNKILKLIYVVW